VPAGQAIPEKDNAYFVGADPGFFATMGISLVAGREFTEHDTANSQLVAVINERYAQRFFANQNPIGQRLAAMVRNQKRDLEIVGVVRNTRIANLRAAPPATVYVAYAQLTGDFPTTLVVRTTGGLGQVTAAVRAAVQARMPENSVDVLALSQQLRGTMVQERMMATLAGAFGVLALTLASVGLYGLLAYTVARRTKEIGIRMALGAQRRRVVMLVLEGAARLVVVGIVVGLPVAWGASRWVRSMLFGLTPTDPTAIVGAVVLLAAVAQLAAFLPARRAAHVDPIAALRHD
jgi:predicted permease